MSDTNTETPGDVQNVAPPAPQPTQTKPAKATSEINRTVLTIHGGPAEGVYNLTQLTPDVCQSLAMIGLRHMLTTAKAPASVYTDLIAGKLPGRPAAKVKELTHEQMAIVHAAVDEHAKSLGIKALPGKKIWEHPDCIGVMADAKQGVAAMGAREIARHQSHPAVAAHRMRLSGESAPSLLGILPAADAPGLALAAE